MRILMKNRNPSDPLHWLAINPLKLQGGWRILNQIAQNHFFARYWLLHYKVPYQVEEWDPKWKNLQVRVWMIVGAARETLSRKPSR